MRPIVKGTLPLALLLVLLYPVWSIMLRPDLDLWATDDAAETHLQRIYAMRLVFRETLAFPRWIPDLYRGYGYPVFNFYSPMVYLVGHLLTITGVSVWNAFRVIGLGSMASGAIGTYYFVRVSCRRQNGTSTPFAAVVASLMYVLAPYPFVINIYLRGNLPEALSLGLVPWFLLAIDQCFIAARRATIRTVLIAAVTGATIVLTHQLSGLLALGAAIVWIVGRVAASPSSARLGFARVALGGLVSGGLLASTGIPSILELPAVHYENATMPIAQLLEKLVDISGGTPRPIILHGPAVPVLPGAVDWAWMYRYPWGIAPTFAPMKPASTHMVIAVTTLVSLTGIGIAGPLRRRRNDESAVVVALPVLGPALLLTVTWFCTTTWSDALWVNLPTLRLVQFPWRLYGPFSLGVALGVAMVLEGASRFGPIAKGASWVAALVAVLLLGVASLGSPPIPFRDNVSHRVDANTILRSEFDHDWWIGGAATGLGDFTPIDVGLKVSDTLHPSGNQVFDRQYPPGSWVGSTALVYAGSARITELRRDGLRMETVVDVEGDGATVAFHQLSFPGWRGYVDGKLAPIRVPPYDPAEDARLGFHLVDVPAGRHVVTVIFGSTLPRITGDAITAVTGISILFVVLGYLRFNWQSLAVWSRTGWIAAGGVACVFAGMAIAQTTFEVVMTLPPRSVPGTSPNLIVANVADLVRSGRTRISSPTGADLGADKFVDVRWLLVGPLVGSRPDVVEFPHGGRQRQWLFMHPSSRVAFDVTVPEAQTFFTAGMALRPEAWYTDFGDGVRFAVDVAVGGATPSEVYAIRLNPRANLDEQRWVEVRVPLASYVGRQIEITLRTDPVDDVRNDWAGWGNPMVVIDRTLLRPVNGPIVPASVGTRPTFPG